MNKDDSRVEGRRIIERQPRSRKGNSMKLIYWFLVVLTFFPDCFVVAQGGERVIPLWESGAPGFEHRRDDPEKAESYWVKGIHNPSLTVLLPKKEKATGAAVVICPGGGHRELVFKAEGLEAAKYLNSIGVAAFALKYRLGREEGSPYEVEKHALQDGQRAIRLVRSRADEFGVDPTRVGMLGFSAGGEVVSMVSYADGKGQANAQDKIEQFSARPDFQALIYPGGVGIPELVPSDAPPAFLLVANDDVGASRSVVSLIPKFRAADVPVEVHIFARGGHAFNMGTRTELTSLADWPARMKDWMQDNFILDPDGRDDYKEKIRQQRERMNQVRKQKIKK